MRYSRDIETLLYEQLTAGGYSASAHVIPSAISSPHVHVVRTGGYEKDMVIEINLVDFDVYADDAATYPVATYLSAGLDGADESGDTSRVDEGRGFGRSVSRTPDAQLGRYRLVCR